MSEADRDIQSMVFDMAGSNGDVRREKMTRIIEYIQALRAENASNCEKYEALVAQLEAENAGLKEKLTCAELAHENEVLEMCVELAKLRSNRGEEIASGWMLRNGTVGGYADVGWNMQSFTEDYPQFARCETMEVTIYKKGRE